MNIEYNIGVDAISMLMLLLTAIVIFCGVLASWDVKEQAKEFFILLNVLVAGVYGVFMSVQHKVDGAFAQRVRVYMNWAHLLLFWPVPVLLGMPAIL